METRIVKLLASKLEKRDNGVKPRTYSLLRLYREPIQWHTKQMIQTFPELAPIWSQLAPNWSNIDPGGLRTPPGPRDVFY